MYVKHITHSTQARVDLKGKGSRQLAHEKDAELPMHLDICARNKKDAEAAEKLWYAPCQQPLPVLSAVCRARLAACSCLLWISAPHRGVKRWLAWYTLLREVCVEHASRVSRERARSVAPPAAVTLLTSS